MPLNQVKTIYSNSYPDKKFYSNERSGFSTATEAVYYMITDLVSIGAMRLVNVKIIDEGNNTIYSGTSGNITERVYSIVNPGSGYRVGDKLQLANGGNGTPLTVNVTAVSTTNGGIERFEIIDRNADGVSVFVNYTDVNPVQPNPLQYVTDDYLGTNPGYYKGSFTLVSNVSNSTGVLNGVNPVPRSYKWLEANKQASGIAAEYETYYAKWEANYGYKGGGGILGDRHPDGSIVVFKGTVDGGVETPSAELPTGNDSLSIGQYIFLVDPTTGTVQANTRIKSISTTSVISDIESAKLGTSAFSWGFKEKTTEAYLLVLDKPITANIGAQFVTRGDKATLDNSKTQLPRRWTATLESLGGCDPLSDYVPVTGNVLTATTNSNVISVVDLTQSNVSYGPRIYVGQTITNVNNVGSGVGNAVTVSNVTMTSATTATVTMSSNASITQGKQLRFQFDPIQPWRIMIEAQDHQMVNIMAGTAVQFDDNCGIARYVGKTANSNAMVIFDTPGIMGAPLTGNANVRINGNYAIIGNIGINENNSDEGFFNRKRRVTQTYYDTSDQIDSVKDYVDYGESYPINTQLTVTDRGIFFGAWEGNFSTLQKKELSNNWSDASFSWFLIQRPVDRITGRILTTGRAPLFCINSVGFKYHKFIVRESDIFHPTQGPKKEAIDGGDIYDSNGVEVNYRTPANANSVDSFAILNTSNQIALTEDSKFLVSFLHNLTTPRFRYSEELDMLGQTSADVCISGNDLSITAYQESGPRKYKALPSNKPYNTGLRVVVLKDIP